MSWVAPFYTTLGHNDVVLLRHNYVIYFLDVVTFFDNVRITIYFGTFELRMETTLQLGFVFAHDVIYAFVVVTFFDDVRAWIYKLRDLEIMGRVRKFLKKILILKNLDSIQHHFSKLKLPKVTLHIEPTTYEIFIKFIKV